jgi:PKD repeat protein
VPINLEAAPDYKFRIETLYMPLHGESDPVSISAKAITYKWDFGDGTQATGPNPTHIYAKAGTYHWTLDTAMNGITCQEKGTITIQPAPTITFTYPSAGHNLEPGTYQTITWNKTGFQDAQVRIKLMRSDTAALNIAGSTENDGGFTWQVPINLEAAPDYKFRIETLYMPLHGESDPVSYKWDFGDGSQSTGANPVHIYEKPGEYKWTLDTTMEGISCHKEGTINTGPAPTITFSYPGAGNNLEPGSYQTITWNKTGFQDAQVRIKLLRSDTVALNLAGSTENDGGFTWQVPINLESAPDYKFRIETLYMPLHGDSDPVSISAKAITYKWDFGDGNQSTEADPVHIYEKPGEYRWTLETTMDGLTCQKKGTVKAGPAPTITFSYPKAGHNLEPGTYQTITWNKTGFQDAQVRIKLLRGDMLIQTLAANTENDGAFTWQVPINLEPAADYMFRIETLYMPVHGNSDPVSITAKPITYKWDFGDNTQATGTNPKHIYTKPGIYDWKMEAEMDGITCTSTGAIVFPGSYIMITHPKQGDNLPIGTHCTITWIKSEIPDATVKIDLLKNGAKVLTITPQTENDGSFDWIVPASREPGTDYAVFMETTDTHINRIGFRFSISKPAIPAAERAALIALYNSTNGDNWQRNTGWKTPPLHTDGFAMPGTENTWIGIKCDAENTTVVSVISGSNDLVGTIPPELGNLTNLKGLLLDKNHLSGSIPPELGNLVNVTQLWIDGNQLKGEIPTGLTNLVKMSYIPTCTNIGYNALYTDDNTLRLFLNKKDPGWDTTQTTAPSDVSAEVLTDSSIKVTWTPIPYTSDRGGYRVYYGKTAGGPYTLYKSTADKTVSSMTVSGLEPGTTYYIVVQTRTEPHQYNENALESDYSQEVSAATTSAVIIRNDPDFNNDGNVDILWRNNVTGENMVWYMDGTARIDVKNLETKDNLKWKIVGTGDFNDDGKVDILWRNFTNGKNRVWFMDGVTKTGAKGLDIWDNLKWRIVGTGDFNGDGQVDILWRNFTNGKNRVWYMDGITKTGAKGLEKWTNMRWRIVGTGDFNGDGQVDILWRNFTNGKNRVWFMDGITKTGAVGLEMKTDMRWEIVGTGDFNGDKKVDILWRNYSNGKNRVWFMDGVTKTGFKGLEVLPDTHWKILDSGD